MTTSSITTTDVEQIQQTLWQANDSGKTPIVYAILGGARDKAIEKIIRLGSLKNSCLIEGKLSYDMAVAAPYMVRLEKDHPQTIEILQKGWGNSWGIFAITYPPATLINIRQNCKKIAKVKLPGNKTAFFRYYDPRVMRPYLPTCTTDEAKQIFGHISEFIMEGEEPGTIHRFKRSEEGVVDVNESLNTFAEPELIADVNVVTVIEGDDDADIIAFKKEIGKNIINQVLGNLKVSPLINTSPNNIPALKLIINQALLLCTSFDLKFNDAEALTKLALAVEHWSLEYFAENEWLTSILMSQEYSTEQKINELYLEKNFRELGAQTLNFPVYCILRFKNRYQDTDYDNAAIHMAADIALKISMQYKITGLTNSYLCTEMVLLNGDNFMADKECIAIQNIFNNASLSENEKISQSMNLLHRQLSNIDN